VSFQCAQGQGQDSVCVMGAVLCYCDASGGSLGSCTVDAEMEGECDNAAARATLVSPSHKIRGRVCPAMFVAALVPVARGQR
jgi:hypothetical protein